MKVVAHLSLSLSDYAWLFLPDLLYKDYYTQPPPIHHYNDRNLAWSLDLAGQSNNLSLVFLNSLMFLLPLLNSLVLVANRNASKKKLFLSVLMT